MNNRHLDLDFEIQFSWTAVFSLLIISTRIGATRRSSNQANTSQNKRWEQSVNPIKHILIILKFIFKSFQFIIWCFNVWHTNNHGTVPNQRRYPTFLSRSAHNFAGWSHQHWDSDFFRVEELKDWSRWDFRLKVCKGVVFCLSPGPFNILLE